MAVDAPEILGEVALAREYVPPRGLPARGFARYRRRVVAGEILVIVTSVLGVYAATADRAPAGAAPVRAVLLGVVPLVWMACLALSRAHEPRFLGLGSAEFERLATGALYAAVVLGAAGWALDLDAARPFVLLALPIAAAGTAVMRYGLRLMLRRRHRDGVSAQTVLLAGHRSGVEELAKTLRRDTYHGMQMVGVCLPGGAVRPGEQVAGVPVIGDVHDAARIAVSRQIDAVTVLPGPAMEGGVLRRLAWELEAGHAELYMAPAVTEVGVPRVVVRPVLGLPLLHVTRPQLAGPWRVAKDVFDRVVALLGLVVVAPLLLAVALAVRLDTRGPVFFRQQRVGLGGRPFTMLKFRSMVADAEGLLLDLRDEHDGNEVLFKMKADPRVTRMGRFLRRTSLDELPQLVNVLVGHMSLVGPRPPLAAEVAMYEDDARRRLKVKPGMTGLWQISGRSDLTWEASVRLDLRYVENWSFMLDIMIIARTVGAVVRSRGAY